MMIRSGRTHDSPGPQDPALPALSPHSEKLIGAFSDFVRANQTNIASVKVRAVTHSIGEQSATAAAAATGSAAAAAAAAASRPFAELASIFNLVDNNPSMFAASQARHLAMLTRDWNAVVGRFTPRRFAEKALSEVDDQEFSEIVLGELLRRHVFGGVIGPVHAALKAAQAPADDPFRVLADPAATARRVAVADAAHDAVMQVPHVGSTEAGRILTERGVLTNSNPADALRKFARDGRLIGLRDGRKWVYPRFQLDHFDPREHANIIVDVNQLLDAGRYPESATSWWISPSGSLPEHQAPVELLEDDQDMLRQLAAAEAAGPDL